MGFYFTYRNKHLGVKDKIKQVTLLPGNYLSIIRNLDTPLVISLNLLEIQLTRTSQQIEKKCQKLPLKVRKLLKACPCQQLFPTAANTA